MTDKPKCELCGEPMPEGEEMFKYHGYSSDCPKPPLEKHTPGYVDSAGDDRVANNVMRHEYRKLDDNEKRLMKAIKDLGLQFDTLLAKIGTSREMSLARTKNEETVMWAVKHLTK